MSSALHDSEDPVDDIRESFCRDAVSGANIIFHALEEGENDGGGVAVHSCSSAFNHDNGGNHSVIACGGIVIKHASVHSGLSDDVVGYAFQKYSADGHHTFSGAKLVIVKDIVSFGISHEAPAEELTKEHVEVSFDEGDATETVDAGGAGLLWDEWLNDFCPSFERFSPGETEIGEGGNAAKEDGVPEEGTVVAVMAAGWRRGCAFSHVFDNINKLLIGDDNINGCRWVGRIGVSHPLNDVPNFGDLFQSMVIELSIENGFAVFIVGEGAELIGDGA